MIAEHIRHAILAAAAGSLALLASSCPADVATAESPVEPALTRTATDAALAWGPCPAFLPAGCGIAVLHGDPSKPNADILFRVPGRSEIARHTHASAERMVLVAGELFVKYDGQPETRLTAGTYAYGPAGRPHGGRCISEAPCILMIAFEGPVDAVAAPAQGR